MCGPARSGRQPPQPPDPTHQQVVLNKKCLGALTVGSCTVGLTEKRHVINQLNKMCQLVKHKLINFTILMKSSALGHI